MTALPFIHIKSAKFPVLPGEDDELFNEGTYGKALALYLTEKLAERSYEMAIPCCEDWGWWVEMHDQPYLLGVCVYGEENLSESQEMCVAVSREPGRQWSWRRFGFVDTSERVHQLFADLQAIFSEDDEVEILGLPEAYPLS